MQLTPIVMIVLDGASDKPGRAMTPLESARTPHLDSLVKKGSLGSMFTVGKGIAPESDAGVFSLLGYNPLQTHLSRGVVEAVGAGVQFNDGDLALRAGFATVEGDRLVDRRAGRNLCTEEAVELGAALNSEMRLKDNVEVVFKPTVGHRAVVVFRHRVHGLSSEISNFDPGYVRRGVISIAQPAKGPYEIPRCEALDGSREAHVSAALVNEYGFKARQILDRHPANERRRSKGWLPANFVLMRDAGDKHPTVPSFAKRYVLRGLMIADLPAELGIGQILEMSVQELAPGVGPDDYKKRAEKVVEATGKFDFVYVHLKGPDEPGHDGLFGLKRSRIEDIDTYFFSALRTAALAENVIVCITCDHSTPCADKGHSDDPVPVLVTGGPVKPDGSQRFTEIQARKGGFGLMEQGSELMNRLVTIARG